MSKSARIREHYQHDRQGKTYAQIARESGVTRQLAHAVLSRKARPLAGKKSRTCPARPFVFRLSSEDELRCRTLARTEGKSLSVFLRDILRAYCEQLKRGEEVSNL